MLKICMASVASHIVDNSKPDIIDDYYTINLCSQNVYHGEFKRTLCGQIKFVNNYAYGKFHGPCTEYYTSGQPIHVYNYRDGLRHGKSTTYYPNGKILWEEDFENDILHGEVKHYSENGNVISSGKFVNGLKEGEHIEIDEKYHSKKVMNYVNNKLHGLSSIYIFGKVYSECMFENGIRVSAKFYK